MKFLSFWSINDGVRTDALCRQMLEMKHHGIEGVVYHPRFYPGHPDYMTEEFIRVTGEVILYAKSIGMEFWIYDENGWPSGSADGQVLRMHPDSRRWGLAYVPEDEIRKDDGVLCRHGGFAVVSRGAVGVSPLCRETSEAFLSLTHERYEKELPREAFDYVTGFFCDEVDYFPGHLFQEGAVPWCADFEAFYTEKYGASPLGELWKLFDRNSEHISFKTRFWETAGDLIARNFYQPYLDWCEKRGKLFTGHLKGEESPYFQLMFSGSCLTQLKHLSLPAIDTLERGHGNHFFPHLLASVSAQQGRQGCLAEAMGGAGWGVSPDDVKRYMLWLAEAGVERIVLHLGQFLLKARAIRDWPPSVPLHLSWHEAFAELLSDIRREAKPLLQAAWDEPKTLIVIPTRGVMAHYRPHLVSKINLHDGSGIPDSASARINAAFLETVENCHAAGWRYHFTEERELRHARLENGKLILGAMAYGTVLIPDGCLFERDEMALIEKIREMGMAVSEPVRLEKPSSRICGRSMIPGQTPWEIAFPKENQMLVEWSAATDGRLSAEIPVRALGAWITLVFSDPIAELKTNAEEQRVCKKGLVFSLSGFRDVLTLSVETDGEALPFAWLKGDFAVLSADGFREFDERQMTCNGRFLLDGSREKKALCAGELVSLGLPFFGGLLTARKRFTLTESFRGTLDFDGLGVCAARVCVDGNTLGWWWKGRALSVSLAPGVHSLSVEAAPSTYNTYGPHHYYLGDFRLTSPDTFFGKGGYTDDPDAPCHTLVDSMQFVKFTVDGDVVFRF